jgi:cell division protein FtsQ
VSSATASTTRSRIDPRIRARRVAVRRDEGRRRLRRLVVLVGVSAVVGLLYLATRGALLDVDHVRLTGAVRSDEAAVLDASRIRVGAPMTDVDLAAARRSIRALPWVDSVSVTRRWPGTVAIRITERQPAAAVRDGAGQWHLVDAGGRVLAPVEAPVEGLSRIHVATPLVAPGATQGGISGALAVATLLTPDLHAWVTAIVPSADGTVELTLVGDITVALGTPAHLADKLIDLATVLTRVDLTDLATIDLTVVHTTVVTRRASPA